MPTEAVEVLIVGGGPSGLAVSRLLADAGRDHVVLEAGRIGEHWRSHRWDSFCLAGANWSLRLPGQDYAGNAPEGFMPRDEIVAYLESYARSFPVPLREGVAATSVETGTGPRCFRVETTDGTYAADHVVVATGANRVPHVPACAAALPAWVLQLAAPAYRNPEALPPGAVLVVGAGQSACQIAEELVRAGRRVYLSIGRCWWMPRQYRGRDSFWWAVELGWMEKAAAKEKGRAPQLTGRDGGYTINLHTLAREGVALLGHLAGVEGGTVRFAPDLAELTAQCDAEARKMFDALDAFAAERRLDDHPPDDGRDDPSLWSHDEQDPIAALDLEQAGISAVIWATGFRRDLSLVRLPAFDAGGFPPHEMGVAAYEGLYFPALHGKDTFVGVTHDAAVIAAAILARTA